jgi:adenylate kinase
MKHVILITGTPCVGKTTTAKVLAAKLKAQYINLTEYAKINNLILGEDTQRQTTIIDEKTMKKSLEKTIVEANIDVIIDGHYAASIAPKHLTTHVFVLRRNPKELKINMKKCGFAESKLYENLAAEILDNCLVEALQEQHNNVCEVDVTGKTVEEILNEILDVLDKGKKGCSGFIDWLGMLENEGILDDYLKA